MAPPVAGVVPTVVFEPGAGRPEGDHGIGSGSLEPSSISLTRIVGITGFMGPPLVGVAEPVTASRSGAVSRACFTVIFAVAGEANAMAAAMATAVRADFASPRARPVGYGWLRSLI